MRHLFPTTLASLAVLAGFAAPVGAALQRFRLHRTSIVHGLSGPGSSDQDPVCKVSVQATSSRVDACAGETLLEGPGPVAVMRRFDFTSDATGTLPIPFFNGFLFLSQRSTLAPSTPATGSGSTNASGTLRWGTLSGWTATASAWCNSRSMPAMNFCGSAGLMFQETVDPPPGSSFYDLGTWTFHGSGFTSVPFVSGYLPSGSGNVMLRYRGALAAAITVPTMPVAGVGALGALLLGAAASVFARRRARAHSVR